MLDVLKATGALDDSIRLSDLDYREAIDALIAGEIDVAMVATQIDDSTLAARARCPRTERSADLDTPPVPESMRRLWEAHRSPASTSSRSRSTGRHMA